MSLTGAHAPPNDATIGTTCWSTAASRRTSTCPPPATACACSTPRAFSAYNFALSDGRPLIQIGTGNGLLPRPVARTGMLLGPAQRADVLVDFHGELGHASCSAPCRARTAHGDG